MNLEMRKTLPVSLTVSLVVGLLMAVVVGGAAFASDGDSLEPADNAPREIVATDADVSTETIENQDPETAEGPDDLAVRIAEILGADPEVTASAMAEADAALTRALASRDGLDPEQGADSAEVMAEAPSFRAYGDRMGAIMGLDGQDVAAAIAQAHEELYAVERGIDDTGSGWDLEDKERPDKHDAGSDSDG